MEDVVPQSNRFFSICQKHICCVIFHWHSIINNPIHFKILHKIWLLFVYILVKPPWFSIPCFGKYFLCSSLFNCLYLFIHTLFLPDLSNLSFLFFLLVNLAKDLLILLNQLSVSLISCCFPVIFSLIQKYSLFFLLPHIIGSILYSLNTSVF